MKNNRSSKQLKYDRLRISMKRRTDKRILKEYIKMGKKGYSSSYRISLLRYKFPNHEKNKPSSAQRIYDAINVTKIKRNRRETGSAGEQPAYT
jgi:hypothetical protein